MGKEDQIKYWIDSSSDDRKAAEVLHKAGQNLQALFFIHLSLEKILKANWVKANQSQPPKVHDLIYLHDQSELDLDAEDLTFLSQTNGWNIEGRYPDYKKSLYKIATVSFTKLNLSKATSIWKKLQEKLL